MNQESKLETSILYSIKDSVKANVYLYPARAKEQFCLYLSLTSQSQTEFL